MLSEQFNRLAGHALLFPTYWAEKFTGPTGTVAEGELSRILQSGHTRNKGWHPVIDGEKNQIVGLIQLERSSGPYLKSALEQMTPLHGIDKDFLNNNKKEISYLWHIHQAFALARPIDIQINSESKGVFYTLNDAELDEVKSACIETLAAAPIKSERHGQKIQHIKRAFS